MPNVPSSFFFFLYFNKVHSANSTCLIHIEHRSTCFLGTYIRDGSVSSPDGIVGGSPNVVQKKVLEYI
jgi:hypothetical protein